MTQAYELRHTCQDAEAQGLSPAQATDMCARCQFLLAATLTIVVVR